MTTEKRQAIESRNECLKQNQDGLRQLVEVATRQLIRLNGKVFETREEAEAQAKSEVFQLLQDRLTEVFSGGTIYRY